MLARLRRSGILGMNRRNARYLLPHNDRRLYPLVDDKLETKRLCERAGIPVPGLLAVARHHFEVRNLLSGLEDRPSFVLKPARGAMGNGILVLQREADGGLVRSNGRPCPPEDFLYHSAGIISGLYSLAGHSDVALVEERLSPHPVLASIASGGVPDVRVILFRGIPVMAMIRLPTRLSGGRANLHQGAIGAGIDLVSGCTHHAVLRNRTVEHHPDEDAPILGCEIPEFQRVLEIAIEATDRTGLGYVGADIVVDAVRGPLILELNARPGLSIQIANRAGLRPRLDAVEALLGKADSEAPPTLSAAERVELGRRIAREAAA
jgi:alpha-L-glutamate ligase-like protein